MKSQKLISWLISKKYDVYVGGDLERETDFWGMLSLISERSGFMSLFDREKDETIAEWIEKREIYVDTDVFIKIKV